MSSILSRLRPILRRPMLLSILSCLTLSIALPGCTQKPLRIGFLPFPISAAEIVCEDAPTTALPPTATVQDGKARIVENDRTGETCRQMVWRTHDKAAAAEKVVADWNKKNGITDAEIAKVLSDASNTKGNK